MMTGLSRVISTGARVRRTAVAAACRESLDNYREIL
jgi:hypothetical protein